MFFISLSVVFGFHRGWDWVSFALVGIFIITGLGRLFINPIQQFGITGMASHLSGLSDEQRESELQRLPEDQREAVLREIENRESTE